MEEWSVDSDIKPNRRLIGLLSDQSDDLCRMMTMNESEKPIESRPGTILEDPAEDWCSIDWQYAEKQVRRLQTKISKAVSEGRTNDAMRFSHLLTVSFLSKALAVRRVCDDPMSGTPGVDKVLWSTDADRMMAARDLDLKGFRPRRLRHFRVRDSGGGRHYVDLPVMRDRAIWELLAMAFEPVHEVLVGGIRSSSADAVSLLWADIAGKDGAGWVLTADITVADADVLKGWMSCNVLIDRGLSGGSSTPGSSSAESLYTEIVCPPW